MLAAFLVAGCNLGETKLGEFDDGQGGSAADTTAPIGALCERGDIWFAAGLSSSLFALNYDIEMECTVDTLHVESEQPAGDASLIHRILNIVMSCESDDFSGEVVLSLATPDTEEFPFEVGQVVFVDASRVHDDDLYPLREEFTVFSVPDSEVLLSSVQDWGIVHPENVPAGLDCVDAWQDRINELTDWLEPLDADLRGSSCVDGGLSVQLADGQLGPARGTDAAGGHRLFVEEATCSTGEAGEHELIVQMGYWRVP